KSLGVSSVSEFIAYVKARPKQVNYGTPGIGQIHHLALETLSAETGISMVHVPYRGGAAFIPALLAGEVSVGFSGLPQLNKALEDNTVTLLAVASAKRSSFTPDIPTFTELGIKNMEYPLSFGLYLPAKTPQEIVDKLSSEVQKAARDPETIRLLRA